MKSVMHRTNLTHAQAEQLAQNSNPYVAKPAQFALEHWQSCSPEGLALARAVLDA